MSRLALPSLFGTLLVVGFAFGPAAQYPSKTSEVLVTYTPRPADPGSASAGTAQRFLKALDDELREQCRLPLDSDERRNWTNVPPRAKERGVRLGDLNEKQLQRACDLLAAVLSKQGYEQARDVMLADDRLLRGGLPRVGFGAENFWLVVFGTPAADRPWAIQLDGHHLALNLTFDGEHAGMSPSFVGTQPASYERDGVIIVPLRGEVEQAFALVGALNEEQRARAVVSPERGRIAAGAGRDGFIPEPAGLECKTLDEHQRGLLRELLRQYVGDLPAPQADERMRALESEIDAMFFAWSGPTNNPSDVSYRIQGPTLIVEYACQDLGGKPLDHLHSMYRNPLNEYGAAVSDRR